MTALVCGIVRSANTGWTGPITIAARPRDDGGRRPAGPRRLPFPRQTLAGVSNPRGQASAKLPTVPAGTPCPGR
jgi:hypothetical protein